MILITGARGQLGRELSNLYRSSEVVLTTSTDIDITDPVQLRSKIIRHKVRTLINCAAYTHVDNAEIEPERCKAVNSDALTTMGVLSREYGFRIVHISTDYVFDGRESSPYTEDSNPAPVGVYGQTKLEGEKRLLAETNLATIIRTSWVYSAHGRNFVNTMLDLAQAKSRLNVVFDQVGCPTNATDLANAIYRIVPKLTNDQPRLFHYSNEGVTSWYDFAKAIFEIAGLSTSVTPIRSHEYVTRAVRPAYSVMDKARIKATFSLDIPHWRDSLKSHLASRGVSKGS